MATTSEIAAGLSFSEIPLDDDNFVLWPCISLPAEIKECGHALEEIIKILKHGRIEKSRALCVLTELKLKAIRESRTSDSKGLDSGRPTTQKVYLLGDSKSKMFSSVRRVHTTSSGVYPFTESKSSEAFDKVLTTTGEVHVENFAIAMEEAYHLVNPSNDEIAPPTEVDERKPAAVCVPEVKEEDPASTDASACIVSPSDPEFTLARAVFVPITLSDHRTVPWPAMVIHTLATFIEELKARKLSKNTEEALSLFMAKDQASREAGGADTFAFFFGSPPSAAAIVAVDSRKDLLRYDQMSPLLHSQHYHVEGYWDAVTDLVSALAPSSPPPRAAASARAATAKTEPKKQAKKRSRILTDATNTGPAKKARKKVKPKSVEITEAKQQEGPPPPSYKYREIELIPSLEDVKPILTRVGYKIDDDRFYLPDCENESSAIEGNDFFTSASALRKHLCMYGIPLKKGMRSRDTPSELEPLKAWVSYHRLDTLLGTRSIPPDLPRLTSCRWLLEKVGISWDSGSWHIPGRQGTVEIQEFWSELARHGLPSTCNLQLLQKDELVALELYLGDTDYQWVSRFQK